MSRSRSITDTIKALFGQPPQGAFSDGPKERYQEYLEANSASEDELNSQKKADISALPVFALAIVGEGSEAALKQTEDSLKEQSYTRWVLTDNPKKEDFGYIMYLWPGDILAPEALFCFAMASEGCDMLFCDEDVMKDGQRTAPRFKSRLSRVTQLSFDILGSGVAVSRALFDAAGGMQGSSGDDRYDYNLRCMAKAARARHIPRVLYTCGEYHEVTCAARNSIAKQAENQFVLPGEWLGSFRVETMIKKPGAVLIIHNKNSFEPLMRLLLSVDSSVREDGVSVLIADRGSTDQRTLRYYDILSSNKAAKIYRGGDVSLSALLNGAASAADADNAVFMESTVEALSPNWLKDLLGQVMRKGIGAVGPKLIGSDGRLLFTGTVIGLKGWQGSAYAGCEDDRRDARKNRFANTLRSVSALSAACMAVRTDVFFNVGCFDESFDFAGFDTEFCLRMGRRGLQSVYVPNVVMRSHAPLSDISKAAPGDKLRWYDAVREILLNGDPYYNRNYDYTSSIPVVAVNPGSAIMINEMYTDDDK